MADTYTIDTTNFPTVITSAYDTGRQTIDQALATRAGAEGDIVLTALNAFKTGITTIVTLISTRSSVQYSDAQARADYDTAAKTLISVTQPYFGGSLKGLRGVEDQIANALRDGSALVADALTRRGTTVIVTPPVTNSNGTPPVAKQPVIDAQMDTASVIVGIIAIGATIAALAWLGKEAKGFL